MRGATSLLCLACLAVLAGGPAFLSGCDRNMEPFVEGEQPRDPDLSKIFPAGADQVARLRLLQFGVLPTRAFRCASPSVRKTA
jgi:hypothetical protein